MDEILDLKKLTISDLHAVIATCEYVLDLYSISVSDSQELRIAKRAERDKTRALKRQARAEILSRINLQML